MDAPNVVIVAGPNGAGKSTAAPALLRDYLGISEFVNADVIAQGLSAFNPEGAAIEAGRVMLTRIHELAERCESFAFETTLAAKSYATFLHKCRTDGYRLHLIFLWIRSPEAAIERVAERVRLGGHYVPDETVRRRFQRGLINLFNTYMPMVDYWAVFDNSNPGGYELIASQVTGSAPRIADEYKWRLIEELRYV